MNGANQQIVAAYESTPADITFEKFCEAFPDYDPEAIRIVLMSESRKYQSLAKKDTSGYYFNEDIEKQAEAMMAQYMSHEKFGFRATKYILDERKGRNDIRALKNLNVNIINIDERMKKAKEALEKSKAQPVIDIPAELQVA